MKLAQFLLPLLSAAAIFSMVDQAYALDKTVVERRGDGRINVRWRGEDPVDVYVSAKPDAALNKARLLARADRDGVYVVTESDPARAYFTLRDERDGSVVRVAERLLPLDRGSNFRDLGGYPAAGGKHVRWGVIYRTAAMPILTDSDYRYIRQLGIRSVIDLRSIEERQIAPDQVPARTGAQYFAADYPASDIFPKPGQSGSPGVSQSHTLSVYRSWPTSLAPQFRVIFQQLLRQDGAVSYHCSAGQDRTGVATALVLSALGVPRDVILEDYQLSTPDRRPENEIQKLAVGEYPGNIVADFYLKIQSTGIPLKARALYDEKGVPYLQAAFDEIEARWGSVENYLDEVLGVDKRQIAQLRAIYLE